MPRNEFSCDCGVIHHDVVDAVKENMLPEETYQQISTFFKVLGDATRTKIIWALDGQELCVCDLANVLNMTKSAVSHQLGSLRRARLVKCRREGKTVYYSLDDDHVRLMFEAGLEHIHE